MAQGTTSSPKFVSEDAGIKYDCLAGGSVTTSDIFDGAWHHIHQDVVVCCDSCQVRPTNGPTTPRKPLRTANYQLRPLQEWPASTRQPIRASLVHPKPEQRAYVSITLRCGPASPTTEPFWENHMMLFQFFLVLFHAYLWQVMFFFACLRVVRFLSAVSMIYCCHYDVFVQRYHST